MISKISYNPVIFSKNNSMNIKNTYSSVKLNSDLTSDMVSFTSKNKEIEEVVKNAFRKLAQNRKADKLGTYMTTAGNANVFLQETKLSKEAKLSLSDGIFGNKSYANFYIKKSLGKPVEITSLDEDLSKTEAKKMVLTYLRDI